MTAIDIGAGATNRASSKSGNVTYVDYNNPANDTGTLTSFQVWAEVSLTSCYAVVFREISSGYFTAIAASENLGAITSGAARTFSVNLPVQVGDFLGVFFDSGNIEADLSGYDKVYAEPGNQTACVNKLFSTIKAGDAISIYGTGATVEGGTYNYFGYNASS